MPRVSATRVLAAILTLYGILFAAGGLLSGQETAPKPKISNMPLAADQLAVYRAVLVSWFQGEKFSVNLSELTSTSTSPDGSETECGRGLQLEPGSSEVHRFQERDLLQLGLGAHIHLVDPEGQAGQVRAHDPGDAIRNGKTVDDAVTEGFAHGLFTLGEIRFNHDHTRAVVAFSFWCGSLCGHGGTVLVEKKNGAWKQKKRCGGWVS